MKLCRSRANSGKDRRVGGLDSKQQLLWLGARLQVISQLRRQLPQSANYQVINECIPSAPLPEFSSHRSYEHLSLLLEVSDSFRFPACCYLGTVDNSLVLFSTQNPVPVQVQSRANMTASNWKGKLDQSQEILSLITRKRPKQFRPCPRVLLAVSPCHKRCGSPCILLISPANWIFYLRVKWSRQTRSRMTIPRTAFPYVRDLTSTAKGFAVRVLDTRLISADVISGDSHPNLDTGPFRCVDSPTFSVYTEHIYQLPPFYV